MSALAAFAALALLAGCDLVQTEDRSVAPRGAEQRAATADQSNPSGYAEATPMAGAPDKGEARTGEGTLAGTARPRPGGTDTGMVGGR